MGIARIAPVRNLLALLAAACLSGCATLRSADGPLATLPVAVSSPEADCLVVLLPGRFDRPEAFVRNGFAEAAKRSGAKLDLLAVDAHLGYYRNGTVVERLYREVVAPARQRYRQVWLAGISLGGAGAVMFAAEHPQEVDGLLLMAPYLGEEDLVAEIEGAGGLSAWQAPESPEATDFARRLWGWLKPYAEQKGPVPLFLGYGRDDDFARANHLLASELPGDRALVVPGGHDWRAWEAVWKGFVGRLCAEPLIHFPRRQPCAL